jgi:hypothetical protein
MAPPGGSRLRRVTWHEDRGGAYPGSVATVLVSEQADGSFAVKVRDGKTETTHVVSVPAGWAASVGAPEAPATELVRASFAFLLEREPATSVLPRFSLDLIQRYFPEYRSEIGSYLAG